MTFIALAGTTGLPGQRRPLHDERPVTTGALLEQAKGAVIARYGVDAAAALRIIESWAAEAEVDPTTLAQALVHDVCQEGGLARSDPNLTRWLAERFHGDCPDVPLAPPAGSERRVSVDIDASFQSLDELVSAAQRAARLGVPLDLTYEEEEHGPLRAHLLQRVDLAVELARAVEPGLVVRLPSASPPR